MEPVSDPFVDARKVAKDWKTYSSDAPFREPTSSEEDVRYQRVMGYESLWVGLRPCAAQ